MTVFIYKAKKDPKRIIAGEIRAEDVNSAISKLKTKGLFPFFIKKKEDEKFHLRSFFAFKNVSSKDIDIFIRQLSSLIHSGLPLAQALNSLSLQTNNRYLKSIIEDIESRIRKGESFRGALSKHSNIFSSFFINIVKAGEVSGVLDETLNRLAEIREREHDLKNQLRNALTYPILLIVISAVTVFVLVTFIIPRFVEMFEELGQVLPLPTRILLNISTLLNNFWVVFLIGVVAVIAGFKHYVTTQKGSYLIDKIKLKLPLFGEIAREIEISRFTRALGTLLKNGIPVLEALKVTSDMVENKIFERESRYFYQGIEEGKRLSSLMKESGVFPSTVSDLVAVGEESAELERILLNISESFEKESQSRIKSFISVLEPFLILILGGIVAFIVISMLLPIFEIDVLLK